MSVTQERDATYLWHPFTQQKTAPVPMEILSANAEYLNTKEFGSVVDLISSWWVTLHGHAHPVIAQAIARQAQTLEHVIFAGCTHAPAANLGAALISAAPSGLARVFYSDNGSTSVEVALKMSLQFWQNKGQSQRKRIVAFCGGYHGDTVGSMSVGAECGFFDKFRSMFFPVDFVTFPETFLGDIMAEDHEQQAICELEKLAESGEVAAIIIEPLVQGASGMRMCRPEFLRKLRAFSSGSNILLIFDEVMTGFGRTGALFAAGRAGVSPDVMCLSKGITGGFLPLSATLVTSDIFEAFLGDSFDSAFVHGHSYTANPISCAAALASLSLFESENTFAKISQIENVFAENAKRFVNHPKVKSVRALGAIFALDFCAADGGYSSRLGPEIRRHFAHRGMLVRPLGNTLYFLPPYCVSIENLEKAFVGLQEFLG